MGMYCGYDCDNCGMCRDFDYPMDVNQLDKKRTEKGYVKFRGKLLCSKCYKAEINEMQITLTMGRTDGKTELAKKLDEKVKERMDV